MQDLQKLWKSTEWLEEIILIFPHESISRYPILIDGKITTEIYNEHEDDVRKLLQQIRHTSKKIKLEIKRI